MNLLSTYGDNSNQRGSFIQKVCLRDRKILSKIFIIITTFCVPEIFYLFPVVCFYIHMMWGHIHDSSFQENILKFKEFKIFIWIFT